MQNLGQMCRFLWAILWTYGQYRGQAISAFEYSLNDLLAFPGTINTFVFSTEIFRYTPTYIKFWLVGLWIWHPPDNFTDAVWFFAQGATAIPQSTFGLDVHEVAPACQSKADVHSRVNSYRISPVTDSTQNLGHRDVINLCRIMQFLMFLMEV